MSVGAVHANSARLKKFAPLVRATRAYTGPFRTCAVGPEAVLPETNAFGFSLNFFQAAASLFGILSYADPRISERKTSRRLRGHVQAWRNVETPTSPGKLFTGKNFDEFLSVIQGEPTESDPEKVPAHLFFLVDSDSSRLLGAIQIRHHINHPNLIETGGHIGYGVCPSERRKGHATRMLALAIPEAKKIGLSRLLVTCKDAKVGSWKVIESNGGVFERTTLDEGQLARRYWIKLA